MKSQLEEVRRRHDEVASVLRDTEIELRALELASSLRPGGGSPSILPNPLSEDAPAPRRGGRQPGSISRKWRQALADFVAAGNAPVDQSAFYLLTRGRTGLAASSVRERVRNYIVQGILTERNGKISVSQNAIESLHLRELAQQRQTTPSADADEVVNGSGVSAPEFGGSRPLTPAPTTGATERG